MQLFIQSSDSDFRFVNSDVDIDLNKSKKIKTFQTQIFIKKN